MLKPLFKATFVVYFWRRYRHTLISTALLILFYWFVGKVHEDYLSYVALQNTKEAVDNGVGWSFVIKWLSYVAGMAIYIAYHLFLAPAKNTTTKESSLSNASDAPPENDPFANLRDGKLRSKADLVIQKNLNTSDRKSREKSNDK